MSRAAHARASRIGMLPLVLLIASNAALAEAFMAVNTGMKCLACHVNPTGGGKRNGFGNIYGQKMLTASPVDDFWDGRITDRVAIGGDLRADLRHVDIPNQDGETSFNLEEVLAYGEVNVLPGKLTLYIDQQIAPSSGTNREAYALYWLRQDLYLKAGRMFLPYGLRLEDDSAFIRLVPGINYTTPDTGIEAGLELSRWSMSLALTNGTGGGGETDEGKQVSALATYIRRLWRVGGSLNVNDTDDGKRSMSNLFGGLKTGPVAWLLEFDYIVDDTQGEDSRKQAASFLEANWTVRQGHILKLTYEHLEPDFDVDEDERTRISGVWEYFPIPFTQVRAGVRANDGIPQNDLQNSTLLFLQLHNYF